MIAKNKKSTFTKSTIFIATFTFSIALLAMPDLASGSRSSLQGTVSNNRYIVGFDGGAQVDPGKIDAVVNEVSQGLKLGLKIRRKLATGAQLIEVDRQLTDAQAKAFMQAFVKRPEVTYVEPDALMTAQFSPNDTHYAAQWHYYEATAGMNLPQAWDRSTGSGAVVAVLDTGSTNHVDLLANQLPGYDFISDTFVSRDGDLRDADSTDEGDWTAVGECYAGSPSSVSSWHGTHVAGTIAAVTNNGIGVAGVAFNAKLQPVRVLGRCGGYLSDIADAIVWASGGDVPGVPPNSTPADVINMSLGGSGSCGSTYQNAINTAVSNGTTVVVAAGNSAADASGFRPANCANVVTVAASDRQGNRAYYSNYGPLVEITAPGGETATAANGVASTLNDGKTAAGNDSYVYYQGTSMATPHISGLAALVYSVHPNPTPAGITQLIQDNARQLVGNCSGCGAGLADAGATVNAVLSGGTPDTPPVAAFTWSCSGLVCDFTNTSTDDNGPMTYTWSVGENPSTVFSTDTSPSYSFTASGTYKVTLAVSDGVNPITTNAQSVIVIAPATTAITASVALNNSRTRATVRWSGATSSRVRIHRNGTQVTRTANDGNWVDRYYVAGASYFVCEDNLSICSNPVTPP